MRSEAEVGRVLADLFGAAPPRKVAQVAALLAEVEPRVAGGAREHVLVDVACGKSYVLHALAALARPRARYIGVDRAPQLIDQCRAAAARIGMAATFFTGEIAAAPLPERPDVLVALHACGAATDEAIAAAVRLRVRHALIAPCCHLRPERAFASAMGLPPHGVLRGRLSDALTDARRALQLETAGFEVTAVEFVAATVTPHNLLLRARYVGPTGRAERARDALARLAQLQHVTTPG